MGTRSITHIHEMRDDQWIGNEEKIVCSFFRHWDGYPSGHGQDLADWLKDKGLKNGIGSDFVKGKHFNRSGSMAIHLCAQIDEISGCEIIPTGSTTGDYIDYTYHIYFRDDEFYIGIGGADPVKASVFNGDEIERSECEE